MPTIISGAEAVRALERAGFVFVSQRGSHQKLRKTGPTGTHTVIVPMHSKLAPGTLSSIIRQAGLSLSEFQRLLES
jgi:predicted RNA binding protein YcfA (HicA-like mRNA interferase family)